MHFDQKMSGIWPENHKQGINFPWFIINRVSVSRSGQHPLPKLKSRTPPPGISVHLKITWIMMIIKVINMTPEKIKTSILML